MPKSSSEQIKFDEKKVINELQENAKESIDRIAKKCGFSRQKVWRIMHHLEKEKKIWGYSAVVDDDKLNQKRYMIFLKRTGRPASKEIVDVITTRKLVEKTKNINVTVEDSYFVHGFFDWVLFVTASNLKEIKRYIEVLNGLFEKGWVSEIKMLEVLFSVEKSRKPNPDLLKIIEFFS